MENILKNKKYLILVIFFSFTLLACRLTDALSSFTSGSGPLAEAENQSSNEDIDVESSTEGSTAAESAEANFENGVNSVFMGHSFFIPVAKAFDVIATQSDFPSHQAELIFLPGQAGAPGPMWENEQARQQVEDLLASGDIDLLGMPISIAPEDDKALGHYQQWIDLALTYNPNTSFFIGVVWMARGPSMEDQKYADLNEEGAQRHYELVKELRGIYPDTHIYLINYGKIASEMKFAFSADQLPDIEQLVGKDETALFADDKIGHGGRLMHELCALTWISILYDAEIDALEYSGFSDEAMQILQDSIEYNIDYQ